MKTDSRFMYNEPGAYDPQPFVIGFDNEWTAHYEYDWQFAIATAIWQQAVDFGTTQEALDAFPL